MEQYLLPSTAGAASSYLTLPFETGEKRHASFPLNPYPSPHHRSRNFYRTAYVYEKKRRLPESCFRRCREWSSPVSRSTVLRQARGARKTSHLDSSVNSQSLTTPITILVIGGSRHIGYYSDLRLLGMSFVLYRNWFIFHHNFLP